MKNFFIWLSGVNKENLDDFEKTKFAGLGSLILIPSLLGFFSMSYAISTVVNNHYIYILSGIMWFFIVLCIDRFLVTTTYRLPDSKDRAYYVAIVSRYIFAIFVGIAVSHPLILLYFDKSISEKIEEVQRKKIQIIVQDANSKQVQIEKDFNQSEKIKATVGAINNKDRILQCLRRLLTNEQSGVIVSLDCGSSSGIKNCGGRCEKIQQQIDATSDEVKELKEKLKKEEEKKDSYIDEIKKSLQKNEDSVRANISKDYLSRVDALADLEKDKSHIKVIKFFILVFFTFVDILPVTMKITTSIGQYELQRATDLKKILAEYNADKDYYESRYPEYLKIKLNYKQVLDFCSDILQNTIDFLRNSQSKREMFYTEVKNMTKKYSKYNVQESQECLESLNKMKEAFLLAEEKAINKYIDFLRKLE